MRQSEDHGHSGHSRHLLVSGLTIGLGIGGYLLTRSIPRKIGRRVAALARNTARFFRKLPVIKRLKTYVRQIIRRGSTRRVSRRRSEVEGERRNVPCESVTTKVESEDFSDSSMASTSAIGDSITPKVKDQDFSESPMEITSNIGDSITPKVEDQDFSESPMEITSNIGDDNITPEVQNQDVAEKIVKRRKKVKHPSVGRDEKKALKTQYISDGITTQPANVLQEQPLSECTSDLVPGIQSAKHQEQEHWIAIGADDINQTGQSPNVCQSALTLLIHQPESKPLECPEEVREEPMQLVTTYDEESLDNTNFKETMSQTTEKVANTERGVKRHIAEIYSSLESIRLDPSDLRKQQFQGQKDLKQQRKKTCKKRTQRKKRPTRAKVEKGTTLLFPSDCLTDHLQGVLKEGAATAEPPCDQENNEFTEINQITDQDLNMISDQKTSDSAIDVQPVTEPKPACDTKNIAPENVYEEGDQQPHFPTNREAPIDTTPPPTRYTDDTREIPSSSYIHDVQMKEYTVTDPPVQNAEERSFSSLGERRSQTILTNLQHGDLREQRQSGSLMGEEQQNYLTPQHKTTLGLRGEKGRLDDDIINIAQDLLKKQFEGFDGLQPIAVILVGGYHAQKPTVQIHYDAEREHWLTSSFKDNTLMIADSISTQNLSPSVSDQIDSLYSNVINEPLKNITLLQVDQQRNNHDCGVFAIANAFELLAQEGNPTCRYQHNLMRKHLIDCLEKGRIAAFPKKA